MIRIGYAPGAFDLFHIGHLNLLRQAKERCDFLIAGVAADEVLMQHKGIMPVVPLAERLEIVRNVRFVYIVAAALGWLVHPLLAVGIFTFVVGYYAWTSQGIRSGR
jgi:glycerol-3-phosphate cytidylyltransferase